MNILFIHQGFPGQFKFLAPALAEKGHAVRALTPQKGERRQWKGVEIVPYPITRNSTKGIHPWISDFESKTIRGQACFMAALGLNNEGYTPDVIVSHPGWGESMFLKDVWPEAKLGIYCEYFYHLGESDVGFDLEFAVPRDGEACRLRLMNLHNLLHFDVADAAISPTHWQASTFPDAIRRRITVVHDGIDTNAVAPDPEVRFALDDDLVLTRENEVITFVNRNLEPMRGFHVFMRALPELLARRPNARVLIVGQVGKNYGADAPGGRSWKEYMLEEVRPKISDADWARVHWLGHITHPRFVQLLQVSTVHVYLTYPFVLSWSVLEAMSAGCCLVASDTAPLREVVRHGETGRFVDFFDVPGLAGTVCELLDDPAERRRLAANARAFARANYDLGLCLPRQMAWVESMMPKATVPVAAQSVDQGKSQSKPTLRTAGEDAFDLRLLAARKA
jgi:glycosyltransferase involved in cell wall biosynthesis